MYARCMINTEWTFIAKYRNLFSLYSNLQFCWHGFCDVNVTLSKLTLGVRPMYEFTEWAEADPIDVTCGRNIIYDMTLSTE